MKILHEQIDIWKHCWIKGLMCSSFSPDSNLFNQMQWLFSPQHLTLKVKKLGWKLLAPKVQNHIWHRQLHDSFILRFFKEKSLNVVKDFSSPQLQWLETKVARHPIGTLEDIWPIMIQHCHRTHVKRLHAVTWFLHLMFLSKDRTRNDFLLFN